MVRRMGQSRTAYLTVARRCRDNACGVCKTHSPKTVRGHRGLTCATLAWAGVCATMVSKHVVERWERKRSGVVWGRSGDSKAMRNSPMWQACTATWAHGDIWTLAAAKGQAWVCGLSTAGVCVDVRGFYHHQRPCWPPWPGLSSKDMLKSEYRTELGQPLISHHMVVPAQCRLGRDGSDPAPCLGSTGELGWVWM